MPDRQKSTSPPPDDGDLLYRHTFLWRITDPGDRAAVLELGKGFDNCINELGCWGDGEDRIIPAMTAALADDVEALAAYSLTIERTIRGSELHVSDAGILWFTPRWAESLAQIAVQMRTVVTTARGTA